MTEGTEIEYVPTMLGVDELAALRRLLDAADQPHVQRVTRLLPGDEVALLRAALQRAELGTMQQHPGLPVHACRAVETVHIGGAEHAVSMPLCDDAARGVVTTDRTLVDCDACLALLAAQQPGCPNRCNDGYVERAATPAEVDAGHELGVAFDPCPSCNPEPAALVGTVDGPPCL